MQNFLLTEQTKHATKQRMNEIDIAKALGILFVLIGHRTEGVLHNYIYLFHMPLFFILSGCMIREEKLSYSHIFFRDNKLFSFYLVYSFLFIVFDLIRYPDLLSFLTNITNICTLYGIGALWFLSSLWIVKLIIRFLFHINKRIIRHTTVILIYIVCSWTSTLLIDLNYNGVIGQLLKSLSWSLVRAGVILIFVYCGFVLKKPIFSFLTYCKKHLILTTVVSLATGVSLIPFTTFEAVDYHLLKNGLFLLNILYGGIGTVLVLSISIIITHLSKWCTRFLVYIGQKSIHYMASEFFRFSLTVPLSMLLGSFPYIKYIDFGIYFILLNCEILIFSPIIDNMVNILNNKLNILASKVYKLEEKRS